jgi:hypothetical protein
MGILNQRKIIVEMEKYYNADKKGDTANVIIEYIEQKDFKLKKSNRERNVR